MMPVCPTGPWQEEQVLLTVDCWKNKQAFQKQPNIMLQLLGMGPPLNSLFSSISVPDSVCVCDLNEA